MSQGRHDERRDEKVRRSPPMVSALINNRLGSAIVVFGTRNIQYELVSKGSDVNE